MKMILNRQKFTTTNLFRDKISVFFYHIYIEICIFKYPFFMINSN